MNSKDDSWYSIKDFDGFVNSTRLILFNNFGEKNNIEDQELMREISVNEQQELDKVLSYSESVAIIKSLVKIDTNEITNGPIFMLNDNIYQEILMALGDRMTSNILSGLVNKGLVEMAFDDEANDFVFWINDEDKDKKSETD